MSSDGLQPGTLLQGTFRVVRWIGRGGMGEVYEARHVALPGRFALKILRPELASDLTAFERFRREARITSALNHPGIIEVVDFGETEDSRPFLAMEFLDGPELATVIANSAPMAVSRVADLVEQIADALAAAHEQGIVHRDLKPQNIFVLPGGRDPDGPLSRSSSSRVEPAGHRVRSEQIKIVDFGIAKVLAATLRLTGNSALLGTPRYMAPEQAIGHSDDVEPRSDQFALAALTYEMLTGRPAFGGSTQLAVMYQVVHEQPAPLAAFIPHMVPELERVVLRGLAKSAQNRFPSVRDFARELRAATEAYAHPSRSRLVTSPDASCETPGPKVTTIDPSSTVDPSTLVIAPQTGSHAADHPHSVRSSTTRERRWLRPALLVTFAVSMALLTNSGWFTSRAPHPTASDELRARASHSSFPSQFGIAEMTVAPPASSAHGVAHPIVSASSPAPTAASTDAPLGAEKAPVAAPRPSARPRGPTRPTTRPSAATRDELLIRPDDF